MDNVTQIRKFGASKLDALARPAAPANNVMNPVLTPAQVNKLFTKVEVPPEPPANEPTPDVGLTDAEELLELFEDDNVKLHEENDRLRMDIAKLKSDLSIRQAQLNAALEKERTYAPSIKELDKFRFEADARCTEVNNLNAENESLRRDNKTLRTETEKLRTEVAGLRTETKTLNDYSKTLRAENNKLRNEAVEDQKSIKNGTRLLAERNKANDEDHATLLRARKEIKELEAKVQSLETRNSDQAETLKSLRAKTTVKAVDDLPKAIEHLKGLMRMGLLTESEVLAKIFNYKASQ